MIAERIAPPKSGVSSISEAIGYIGAPEKGKPEFRFSHNGDGDFDAALRDMKATISDAGLTADGAVAGSVDDPVYHFVISLQEGEEFTSPEQSQDVISEHLAGLGYDGHEYVAALHTNTQNRHIHVLVNRVNPITLQVKTPHGDFFELSYTCRMLEVRHGFASEANSLYRTVYIDDKAHIVLSGDLALERKLRAGHLSNGAFKFEKFEGGPASSLESFLQQNDREVERALIKAASWNEAHSVTEKYGLAIETSHGDQGLVITHKGSNVKVSAGKAGSTCTMPELEKRFGEFKRDTRRTELEVEAVLNDMFRQKSWLTEREVEAYLRRYDGNLERQNQLKQSLFDHQDFVHLESDWQRDKVGKPKTDDPAAEIRRFTSRAVLEREADIIALGEKIASRGSPLSDQAIEAAIEERRTVARGFLNMDRLKTGLNEISSGEADKLEDELTKIALRDGISPEHHLDTFFRGRLATHAVDEINAGRPFDAQLTAFEIEMLEGLRVDQKDALTKCAKARGIAATTGEAGTGKTFMLGGLKAGAEHDGKRVKALAPTNKVVQNLTADGFDAMSIAMAITTAEKLGVEKLDWNENTIIAIDEMGMVADEDIRKLISIADKTGARFVWIGDPQQLDSISAGGVFAHFVEKYEAGKLTHITRQKKLVDREIVSHLEREDYRAAVDKMNAESLLEFGGNAAQTRDMMFEAWRQATIERPDATRLMIAYTRADVAALNDHARSFLKERGHITDCKMLSVRSDRQMEFGIGDRIVLTENKVLEIRNLTTKRSEKTRMTNGEIGRVVSVRKDSNEVDIAFDVRGETIRIKLGEDAITGIMHAQATTTTKTQGDTVQEVFGLVDRSMTQTAGAFLITASRHKESVRIFVPRELAVDGAELARQLSQARHKTVASSIQVTEKKHDFRPILSKENAVTEDLEAAAQMIERGNLDRDELRAVLAGNRWDSQPSGTTALSASQIAAATEAHRAWQNARAIAGQDTGFDLDGYVEYVQERRAKEIDAEIDAAIRLASGEQVDPGAIAPSSVFNALESESYETRKQHLDARVAAERVKITAAREAWIRKKIDYQTKRDSIDKVIRELKAGFREEREALKARLTADKVKIKNRTAALRTLSSDHNVRFDEVKARFLSEIETALLALHPESPRPKEVSREKILEQIGAENTPDGYRARRMQFERDARSARRRERAGEPDYETSVRNVSEPRHGRIEPQIERSIDLCQVLATRGYKLTNRNESHDTLTFESGFSRIHLLGDQVGGYSRFTMSPVDPEIRLKPFGRQKTDRQRRDGYVGSIHELMVVLEPSLEPAERKRLVEEIKIQTRKDLQNRGVDWRARQRLSLYSMSRARFEASRDVRPSEAELEQAFGVSVSREVAKLFDLRKDEDGNILILKRGQSGIIGADVIAAEGRQRRVNGSYDGVTKSVGGNPKRLVAVESYAAAIKHAERDIAVRKTLGDQRGPATYAVTCGKPTGAQMRQLVNEARASGVGTEWLGIDAPKEVLDLQKIKPAPAQKPPTFAGTASKQPTSASIRSIDPLPTQPNQQPKSTALVQRSSRHPKR